MTNPVPTDGRPTARRRRGRTALIAGLLVTAVTVAGCAGLQKSTDGAGTGGVPTTVRVAYEAPISTLDPLRSGSFADQQVQYLINGQLTKFGAGNDLGQPSLAQRVTESADRLTWTAVLRPDLVFSDGTPITAEDVVASFRRVLDDPAGSKLPEYTDLKNVTSPGPGTVTFTLSRPRASFSGILAQNSATIYPAAGLRQGQAFFAKPVSAGRYQVDSADFVAGHIVLSANPHYPGTPQKVRRVEFTLVPDAATRLAQLQNAEVDYAHNLPTNLIPQMRGAVHQQNSTFPGGMIPLFLNYAGIMGNTNVRQAINLAVDRDQISRAALAGVMQPKYGFFPADQVSGQPKTTRNVAEAKRLLNGTPCEHGCTVKFLLLPDFNWQIPPVTTVVQQNLKDIGIDVQLLTTPISTFAKRTQQGGFDGFVLTPASLIDRPDLVAARQLDPAGSYNTSYHLNVAAPQLHDLVQQLEVAPAAQQPAIAQQAEQVFARELPFIPLTELTFVSGSRLPAEQLSTTLGWYLNLP
ncbi:peptide/nickel transport system substrate-binding protein [Amycolatopsis bartoniae]|nr:ABC transporter substrate-binding protein [Amycolatopsis bartoniae]MBB2933458.1 peptide/nickel transport system substrate-binding protein [Amycolatopsis bartoniae]